MKDLISLSTGEILKVGDRVPGGRLSHHYATIEKIEEDMVVVCYAGEVKSVRIERNEKNLARVFNAREEEKKVWILTREVNAYDQEGEYFVAVYANKPNAAQLKRAGVADVFLRHVMNGGGRKEWENEWFYLKEMVAE